VVVGSRSIALRSVRPVSGRMDTSLSASSCKSIGEVLGCQDGLSRNCVGVKADLVGLIGIANV
jgi:hypothetical protein